jgi:hypothetical protein
MLLASEWAGYYQRKKILRVSSPQGNQRSSYFLQLPLKYSVPLLASSAMLHWLWSQSIFLARIDVFDEHAEHGGNGGSGEIENWLGFSCWPLFFAVLLALAVTLFVFVVGYQRLEDQMPIVGSCSLAISAACHPPAGDDGAALLPVNWGRIATERDAGKQDLYSFTSHDVGRRLRKRLAS